MYNLPYDAPNDYVTDGTVDLPLMDGFGTVHKVRYQSWTNLPEVSTGTSVVRINLHPSIPRFLRIHTYCCKVWYRGQPVYCDICKEGTHLASNCPYKKNVYLVRGWGILLTIVPRSALSVKVIMRRSRAIIVAVGSVLLMKMIFAQLLLTLVLPLMLLVILPVFHLLLLLVPLEILLQVVLL